MGYRKFKGEHIYTGEDVLPADTVLITEENGIIVNRVNVRDAGDGVETFEGLLTPGFVNSHCHLELSHMKGKIAPGSGLVQFLTRVIQERQTDPIQLDEAMNQAERELLASGTVAVGDICNTTDSLHMKKTSTIHYKNFIEVMGFREEEAAARFAAAEKIANAFSPTATAEHGRYQRNESLLPGPDHWPSFLCPSLTPHAPYSVSLPLFHLINVSSEGKVITIHNQETDAENQLYANGSGPLFQLYRNLHIDASNFKASGRSSLQTILPWLNKPSGVILVHNTYTQEADILFADAHNGPLANLYFCICINANRYIESRNPPLDLLRRNKCTITIGTDSYASNRQLNMLEEIKVIHEQFPLVPLPEILQWATINGARALGMSGILGSFDQGKQPGIVLINNIDNLHVSPDSTARKIL
ncbi:MAG: amidohydrolase family protein [Chitinophagaceae bacterium]